MIITAATMTAMSHQLVGVTGTSVTGGVGSGVGGVGVGSGAGGVGSGVGGVGVGSGTGGVGSGTGLGMLISINSRSILAS